jgi:hypothetical protein
VLTIEEWRLTPAASTIDWARVAAWTEAVLSEDLDGIAKVFVEHGAGTPLVVWKPGREQLRSEPPRHVLAHWTALVAGPRLPGYQQMDPVDLRPALGYVMLLDLVEGGRDFRYRLFGSLIGRVSGFDMTGKLLSEHPASAYVTEFSLAVGRAAVQRREPVYTRRRPVGAQDTSLWERLVLPLVDEEDKVVRLMVVSTPLDRDGTLIRTVY